ncbi:hypothetical protein SRHO_G00079580 [Serrasalmus rhombeus]
MACSLRAEMSQCNNPVPVYSSYKAPQVRIVVPESFSAKVEPKEGEEAWPDSPAWSEPDETLDKGMCNLKLDKQALRNQSCLCCIALRSISWVEAYKNEMPKLIKAGAVREVTQETTLKE